MINTDPNILGHIIIETATTSNEMPMKIVDRIGKDRLLGEGCVQEANMKNRNGRFYDSRDLYPQLLDPRQQELVSTGNMRAENGHPLSKDLVRQQTIDPNNTVAIFTKFWTDGDLIMSRYFGTFNANGEEFNKELECGILPSWSLRALGTIKNTSRGAEVKGIKIITYDRVIYPSHDKAYTHRVVSEGGSIWTPDKDIVIAEGSKLYMDDNDPGMAIPITNESVIDYIKEESMNIKQIKESFDLLYDEIKLVKNKSAVQLTDRAGAIYVINLENYIHNEIIGACIKSQY